MKWFYRNVRHKPEWIILKDRLYSTKICEKCGVERFWPKDAADVHDRLHKD